MPWLPIYATEQDLHNIFAFLNDDEEVAFLVKDGPEKWIAKKNIDYVSDARYCIWHVPSGPLPLVRPNGQEDGLIEDPWQGWNEERAGADPTEPYFGAGHPGVIWLNARASSNRKNNGIGLSSFEWIGNWYRVIGNAALETTEKFWKRLGRRVKKGASRIPREGPWDGEHPEIWALPAALTRIKCGTERDKNP
jgi:hypothetical protein